MSSDKAYRALHLKYCALERELAAAIAERDKAMVALKTIEGHHNENDSWRDIAREALKECGK